MFHTNCYYTVDVTLLDAIGMTWILTEPIEGSDNTPSRTIIDTAKRKAIQDAGHADYIAKPVSVTGVKFVI